VTTLVENVEFIRDLLRVAGIDHPNVHGAIAGLTALRREAALAERQLAELRGETGRDELAPRVHEIGAYWRERCNHPRAKIDGKRYRAVRARLAQRERDESVDDRVAYIKQAIDGAAAAPNVSDTGERYDDLELICRNESKLDSFAARAPKPDAGNLERKLIGA
jgi:hypothetical protein